MTLPRVAIVCDVLEEEWPSMDLVADMLLDNLAENHATAWRATRIRPKMRRRFSRPLHPSKIRFNIDRFVNRFWDYPRWLRDTAAGFELFHIVDHSYAHLVHQLPAARTVVTCHDLDLFRCLVASTGERRSQPFRAMARHVLRGLQKAVRVTCDSDTTRRDLIGHGLLPAERVVTIPNGVHPSCVATPDPGADAIVSRVLGPCDRHAVDILHVGATVPRKRIDVLLHSFAKTRATWAEARLIRVGGPFTAAQMALAERLGVSDSIRVMPFLERPILASLYRRAALVLQPSEREGFGLPVIEALACGTPVVASDLPVLREVGGGATTYCPMGDVDAWVEVVDQLLRERRDNRDGWTVRRLNGVAHAEMFTWSAYTRRMVTLYEEVLNQRAAVERAAGGGGA